MFDHSLSYLSPSHVLVLTPPKTLKGITKASMKKFKMLIKSRSSCSCLVLMNIFFLYFVLLFDVSRSIGFYVLKNTDKVRLLHWQVKFELFCLETQNFIYFDSRLQLFLTTNWINHYFNYQSIFVQLWPRLKQIICWVR